MRAEMRRVIVDERAASKRRAVERFKQPDDAPFDPGSDDSEPESERGEARGLDAILNAGMNMGSP